MLINMAIMKSIFLLTMFVSSLRVGQAITNSIVWRMESELAAITDSLTQLANRRHFNEVIDREWKRCARNKQPLSILLLDIDFFKGCNDHYGHLYGDQCLQKVAACLKRCICRPADLVARYGGEEFIVLLPETPLDGALVVAEKIREAILDLRIANAQSSVNSCVTVSVGVSATIPGQINAVRQYINHADQALYRAKNTGRNQVVAAE